MRIVRQTLVMLGISIACFGMPPQVCNHKLPDKLAEAWQKKDPAAVDLVSKVLEDSLNKTYCYNLASRDNAFDLIQDLKLTEVMPLLREVAAMDCKASRDYQQTWDLESIRRSLDILAELHDPSAVALNKKRIVSDVWLQAVAIRNLVKLDSWDSTAEVMRLLIGVDLDSEHQNVIKATLAFLKRSPRTDLSICPRVQDVATAFAECFSDPNVGWRCGDLVPSIAALNERFRCGISGAMPHK